MTPTPRESDPQAGGPAMTEAAVRAMLLERNPGIRPILEAAEILRDQRDAALADRDRLLAVVTRVECTLNQLASSDDECAGCDELEICDEDCWLFDTLLDLQNAMGKR